LDEGVFLEYISTKEGMNVNFQKIKAIMKWRRKINITVVKSSLGQARNYSIFVKVFSKITFLLINLVLLKKATKFECVDKYEEAF